MRRATDNEYLNYVHKLVKKKLLLVPDGNQHLVEIRIKYKLSLVDIY